MQPRSISYCGSNPSTEAESEPHTLGSPEICAHTQINTHTGSVSVSLCFFSTPPLPSSPHSAVLWSFSLPLSLLSLPLCLSLSFPLSLPVSFFFSPSLLSAHSFLKN